MTTNDTIQEKYTREHVEKMLQNDVKAAISLLTMMLEDRHLFGIISDIVHERVNSLPSKEEK